MPRRAAHKGGAGGGRMHYQWEQRGIRKEEEREMGGEREMEGPDMWVPPPHIVNVKPSNGQI